MFYEVILCDSNCLGTSRFPVHLYKVPFRSASGHPELSSQTDSLQDKHLFNNFSWKGVARRGLLQKGGLFILAHVCKTTLPDALKHSITRNTSKL